MSQSQTVKTAIHEVAHAKLHDREQNQDIDAVLDLSLIHIFTDAGVPAGSEHLKVSDRYL